MIRIRHRCRMGAEQEQLLVTPPSLSDPLTCNPLGCSLTFSPHFISLLALSNHFIRF